MKRAFDIALSAIGLVLTFPLVVAIAAVLAVSPGRPILFRQMRVGRGGREFELVKFRTMREAFGPGGELLPDEERVTAFGRFLRRSRLDELPELWLILRGDMSFVGPRPLPRRSLEAHGVLERRSRSRPGLTGLAQVTGNTRLTDPEKFAIDIFYNDRRSFTMDVGILARTVITVMTGEKRDEAAISAALDYAKGRPAR